MEDVAENAVSERGFREFERLSAEYGLVSTGGLVKPTLEEENCSVLVEYPAEST